MELSVVVGIIGGVCSIVFAYVGYQRGLKKDSRQEGKADGTLMSDVGYIKAGVDDLKREQKDTNKNVGDLTQRVVLVEQSTKSAHKRIDEMKEEMRHERTAE